MMDTLKRALAWILSWFPTETAPNKVKIHNTHYRIIKKIGEGGFSFVYLVRPLDSATELSDIESGRGRPLYALKKLRIQMPEQEEAFRRELAYHRQFPSHPNIIQLVDGDLTTESYGWMEGLLLFPFYTRGTVQDLVDRTPYPANAPEMSEIMRIFVGVCNGLLAFHEAQPVALAFRDLKPANVLIGKDGQGVLMDLGSVAPAIVTITNRREALRLQETCAETCTAPYRPPELFEVASSTTLDGRTDVWSLACTLFALAFGKVCFEGTATSAMSGRIPYPTDAPHYTSSLQPLISEMLAVDMRKRPDVRGVLANAKRYGLIASSK